MIWLPCFDSSLRREIRPLFLTNRSVITVEDRSSQARDGSPLRPSSVGIGRGELFLGDSASTVAHLRIAHRSQNALAWSCRRSSLRPTDDNVSFRTLSRGVYPRSFIRLRRPSRHCNHHRRYNLPTCVFECTSVARVRSRAVGTRQAKKQSQINEERATCLWGGAQGSLRAHA